MKFKDWFDKKLKVIPYPSQDYLLILLTKVKIDIIINVSDQNYDFNLISMLNLKGILYFWFPMNESKRDIGLNSIYGALNILWNSEKNNQNVIIHCHAGVNRSMIIYESYHFLRTKLHYYKKEIINPELEAMFIMNDEEKAKIKVNYPNKVYASCCRGYLPPLSEYERFLNDYNKKLQSDTPYGLDDLKIKNINNF